MLLTSRCARPAPPPEASSATRSTRRTTSPSPAASTCATAAATTTAPPRRPQAMAMDARYGDTPRGATSGAVPGTGRRRSGAHLPRAVGRPHPARPPETRGATGSPGSHASPGGPGRCPRAPPSRPPPGPAVGSCAPTLPSGRPTPFARRGERSIARAYGKAFARARRLIVIEDQYLWSAQVADVATALRRAPTCCSSPSCPATPSRAACCPSRRSWSGTSGQWPRCGPPATARRRLTLRRTTRGSRSTSRQGVHRRRRVGGGLGQHEPALLDPRLGAGVRGARRHPRRARAVTPAARVTGPAASPGTCGCATAPSTSAARPTARRCSIPRTPSGPGRRPPGRWTAGTERRAGRPPATRPDRVLPESWCPARRCTPRPLYRLAVDPDGRPAGSARPEGSEATTPCRRSGTRRAGRRGPGRRSSGRRPGPPSGCPRPPPGRRPGCRGGGRRPRGRCGRRWLAGAGSSSPGITSMTVASSMRSDGNGSSPRRHSSTRSAAGRGGARTSRGPLDVRDDEHGWSRAKAAGMAPWCQTRARTSPWTT